MFLFDQKYCENVWPIRLTKILLLVTKCKKKSFFLKSPPNSFNELHQQCQFYDFSFSFLFPFLSFFDFPIFSASSIVSGNLMLKVSGKLVTRIPDNIETLPNNSNVNDGKIFA